MVPCLKILPFTFVVFLKDLFFLCFRWLRHVPFPLRRRVLLALFFSSLLGVATGFFSPALRMSPGRAAFRARAGDEYLALLRFGGRVGYFFIPRSPFLCFSPLLSTFPFLLSAALPSFLGSRERGSFQSHERLTKSAFVTWTERRSPSSLIPFFAPHLVSLAETRVQPSHVSLSFLGNVCQLDS